MTRPRDGNYVWVTWLAKLMAGETQCAWSAWFKTHYTAYPKAPSDFQLAQWQTDHNQLLYELVEERSALGERCYKEHQNSFALEMAPSLVLAGKPDLITVDPRGMVTVWDAKTGKRRQSDFVQTMLYMLCLPSALPLYRGKAFAGQLVYKSGDREQVPPDAVSKEFKRCARYFLNLLDAPEPAAHTPSSMECRFCDITAADCGERIEWAPSPEAVVPTMDWTTT